MEGVRFEFTMSTPESELAIWDVDTMENHVQYVGRINPNSNIVIEQKHPGH